MSKKESKKIKLSNEKRTVIIEKIKQYFLDEKNEEIGDLSASIFLDFITEEIAPEFYNQGVYDAYLFMNEKAEDVLGLQK